MPAAGEKVRASHIAGLAQFDSVPTDESTASTSYTNLATTGPSVSITLVAGQSAKVYWTADAYNTTADLRTFMGIEITGASGTTAAADSASAKGSTGSTNSGSTTMNFMPYTATSTGSHTFTAKYKVTSGTGHWINRRLLVEPEPIS
jgi:hypothetical protein